MRSLDLAKWATLIDLNKEINDIMKIVKPLEKSGLLIKGISKTIKNATKAQKVKFLGMLLGTWGARWLENPLTAKDTVRAGEGTTRAVHGF